MPNLTLYTITSILILDSSSTRILAKYFRPPPSLSTTPQQRKFECGLHAKTKKQNSDVLLYENHIVVYKQLLDTTIYVAGNCEENEVMLYNVVVCIKDTLEILLKHSLDKRSMLENYDQVCLAVEETCDDGIILETEPTAVAARVSKPSMDTGVVKVELTEQGLMNAYQMAKEKLKEQIIKGGYM
ncbi:putative coatomer subunit zeta [Neolecta irregularis DAH-3]|uniref:Coatomer subunit zeta n=1 Tax=Neolecta irregularis (strain DAH-3) TaxID=1198029 RepID=A0A1U7LMU1_NEOID|nr:putative coatomer subunit zeta [Neolecta irregularis DAH-3]|eukprot:OLL23974.1 putative coatomer subunit zeta [Neolecta irregularis DAH-3]